MSIHIVIIAPGRDISPWQRTFGQIAPEATITAWPEIRNKEKIELAMVWNQPEGILRKFPNLKLISSLGAGVDHILKDKQLPSDIPIMRIADQSLSNAMSNYIIMAVLNYQRNFHQHLTNQSEKKWDQQLGYKFSLQIGFLGLGVLAIDAAQKLVKLGFKVRGFSTSQKDIEGVESYDGPNQWSRFLTDLDVLINLLPLTPKTHHILNLDLFKKLTKPILLVNVARGEHLDESDLILALRKGWVSMAHLDVFQEEPLPQGHPFWSHPKIHITPHVAAITYPKAAAQQVLANFQRLKEGKKLLHLVDLERYY